MNQFTKSISLIWIHTSLFEIQEFPVFAGYGDIGISNALGKTEGTGDLLDPSYFRSMAKDKNSYLQGIAIPERSSILLFI